MDICCPSSNYPNLEGSFIFEATKVPYFPSFFGEIRALKNRNQFIHTEVD
jgi:hypothetical protein